MKTSIKSKEHLSKVSKYLWIAVVVGWSLAGGWFARQVPVSTLVSVCAAMVALAGVVVTIFGIWVAIIFPRLIAGLESGDKNAAQPQLSRYDTLIAILYRSCFVLVSSIFVLIVCSFYGKNTIMLSFFVAMFIWLAFFSITTSLFVAVGNGELAVSSRIDESSVSGMLRRLRRQGQRSNRDDD